MQPTPPALGDEPPPLEVLSEVPERAMVVFAHPDDAELGAGGVTAVWAKKGCEITYVACTTGSGGSNDRSMDSQRLASIRRQEQIEAAKVLGIANVEFLDHSDGGLEDNRDFRGEIVRLIRKYRPDTVFCHDPHRLDGFNHRDHRIAGTVVLDSVYPYARDHLHFPEHIKDEGLEPYKVRQVLLWGSSNPTVVVDTTEGIDTQIEALSRHESQIRGLSAGSPRGERLRARAAERAEGYPFEHAQRFRRLIART